jgi:hypothetical protein
MQHVPKQDTQSEERHQKIEKVQSKKKSKKRMFLIIGGVIGLLILAGIGYATFSPGPYDGFAKCLSDKGVVMYGEDWCPYTNAQKGMFGKSFKHIDYVVKENLNMRPTWVIDGEEYETVQSFERLSSLTGCTF